MTIIMIVSNSPDTGSGFAQVAGKLAIELAKLGNQVAITGLQNVHTMQTFNNIPIFPIVGDASQGHPVFQKIGLAKNIKMHRSEAVLYCMSTDGKTDGLTEVHPNTVWYMVLDEELIYNPYPLLNAAWKVKKVVAMTHCAGKQLEKQGISNTVIYPGRDPSIIRKIHKGFDKDNKELVIFFSPSLNRQDIMQAGQIPAMWEERGINFLMGFVGQNHGLRKRIELLLEAFSIFAKDKGKEVHLHLHTFPTNIPNDTIPFSITGIDLIQLAEYFGIKDKISFSYGAWRSSGWSDEALNVLYNTFDVFATASSGGGFELANFESASIGVPQICPDVMPFNELYPDGERGLLAGGRRHFVESGAFRFLVDPQQLANKMQIMYEDRQLRDKLSRNCKQWAAQYTWEKTAAQFDELFKNLVKV
jgi:glycosyltransferase involved in cell wall biosynthesis